MTSSVTSQFPGATLYVLVFQKRDEKKLSPGTYSMGGGVCGFVFFFCIDVIIQAALR